MLVEDIKLTKNALTVLDRRYLARDGEGRCFKESRWEQTGLDAMRNAAVTTIAPTGLAARA